MQKERILVISHGHPDFSLGGGEIAAYNLYKAYRNHESVETAWFIGRIDRGQGAPGLLSRRRDNEYLWETGMGDSFLMKAANPYAIWHDFRALIHNLKPTIVHLHHYFHMGVEMFRIIKQENPDIKLMLTLHEYMAICQNQGQMVKRGSNDLCLSSSLDDCNRCFPEFSREQFWLRNQFLKRHFDEVDAFVAPSEFLRQRYIDWGIAPERITVIENGQKDSEPLAPRTLPEDGTRNRFAFFGQINPFKGIDLVLQALTLLPKKTRKQIVLEIHGANLEHQSEQFRHQVDTLAQPLVKEGVLNWVGPYRPEQLHGRMAKIDWVMVPSIWWENSPMVIQEAFTCGRPVICSNIGGMAEKVTDGVDGLHFDVRNPTDLGTLMAQVCGDNELWDKLNAGIKKPLTYQECAVQHLDLLS
jgi:glycosyltransferase involved in cell wall biosynthesis